MNEPGVWELLSNSEFPTPPAKEKQEVTSVQFKGCIIVQGEQKLERSALCRLKGRKILPLGLNLQMGKLRQHNDLPCCHWAA